MRIQLGLMVLGLLTVSLSYGQNQAKTYREQMSQIERIKVVGVRGSVKLIAQTTSGQAVVKIARRKGSVQEEWRESVRRDGSTLVVEIQAPSGRIAASLQEQKAWPLYDVEVTSSDVPAEIYWHAGDTVVQNWRAPVMVTQQTGKVSVTGGEGECRLSLTEGKLNLADRRGRIFLDAYNVDLTAKNLDGDAQIENFNGKSTLHDLKGQIQLRSGSGSTQLSGSQGALDFRFEKGTLNVAGFAGAVRGTSDQANISVAVEEPVDVRLRARDGRLSVSVPQGSGASVNVETREGELVLPRTLNVRRESDERVAVGELPGSGKGYIFIRSESALVRIK